jgi:hypothetical protein
MFIRKVEYPTLPPAQCKICGAASQTDREYWIDTGTTEEFFGAIYYCSVCIEEIAGICGFLSIAGSTKLKERLADAQREVRYLKECLSALSGLGIDVSAISQFIKDHPAPVEANEGELAGLLEGAADAAQSTNEPGSDDVPNSKPRRPKLALD